ncbi:type III secretion system inner membrane ring subunit SctD [Bordetella genomosp. 11]|uniref:EscD/YscD/HrpQ family type III secretion system inner membrane ring protein n=1 Tax=Bordetella genomosp. 11 TaxID=1416808 RepID=A0A261ULD0_9BORD|nr:type III secretion system inner membrane ring subunit SctD [Bordetella genomosp. 11]OZI62080.1 EscD/YscD/HrpQ family type III secretion system inner membrane ring protein [Bordetella genomosp. 11]
MTQGLELRVLSGIHDGARCAVQDGALIGSQGDCHVVLCDEGIAAEAGRLRIGLASWSIHGHDGPAGNTREVRFGTPLSLGPVLLTVALAADPWPDAGQVAAARAAASDSPDEHAGTATAQDVAVAVPATAATASDGWLADDQDVAGRHAISGQHAARARTSRRRKGLGLRWAVGGLLIVLVFGSVASFPPAKTPSTLNIRSGQTRDPDMLLRAQGLLAERGYAPRVRAIAGEDQEIVVTGWVRDELEHDRLATALSTIWPLPAMRVGKETEVETSMGDRMRDLDVLVALVRTDPDGLAIHGTAGSDAARQQAYQRWHENTATAPWPPMKLTLATEVADALNLAAAAAGLPPPPSVWKDKTIRVDPRGLVPSQREKLKDIVDTLNHRYANALRIDGDDTTLVESIPFRVQTVVGGQQPWVVLDDGTRIAVGGTHGAYRLTSVEDGSVVFDGPTTTVIRR